MKNLKFFLRSLLASFVLLVYCTQCFAVFIVDVDVCYRPVSFMANYTQKTSNRSLRVLCYDSDINKINFIHYHPYGGHISSYQRDYETFVIEYEGDTQNFNVTPKPNTTTWFRSSGQINSSYSENLALWDETRNGYSFLKQSPFPDYASSLEKITNHLNNFDLPLKAEQAPKGQKQWRKKHRQFSIAFAPEAQQLYPISWENIEKDEFGDIGELACDLTMMILGFTKHDAKYEGNKGIDGFYTKDSIIIAAEAKMWKNDGKCSAPDLDTIDRSHLTPKFNRTSNGAIVRIETEKPEIYAKIVSAHICNKLYTVPFGVLPDGTAYMRINQRSDLIQPEVVQDANEKSNALISSSAQKKDSSFVTPKKEKDVLEHMTSDEFLRRVDEMPEEEREKILPQLQKLFKKMNIQSPSQKESEDEIDYEHQEFLKELYNYLRITEVDETCDIQMINESFEVIRGIYENSIERSGNVSVINFDGARLFQKAILFNTSLKELSLHDIDDAKLKIIQVAFRENSNLSLKVLSIFGTISDESMENFSLGIQNCTSLRALSLKACSIRDDGACYLADALCVDNHALTTLNLSLNHIGLKGAKALAKMIKLNPNLRRIYLHGNSEVGQEGVDLIRESMRSNFRLNDVTLTGCS